MQFTVSSIGKVVREDGYHVLAVDEEYRGGLSGLQGFSHMIVVWWAHLYAQDEYRQIKVLDSPYTYGPGKIGVFATRSPVRPNPLGISVVQIDAVDPDTGVVKTPYIDAEQGTPILDIKPYHPSEDRIREVAVPEWCEDWPKWMEDSEDFDWEKVFNF